MRSGRHHARAPDMDDNSASRKRQHTSTACRRLADGAGATSSKGLRGLGHARSVLEGVVSSVICNVCTEDLQRAECNVHVYKKGHGLSVCAPSDNGPTSVHKATLRASQAPCMYVLWHVPCTGMRGKRPAAGEPAARLPG
jgi:hypothetical protein